MSTEPHPKSLQARLAKAKLHGGDPKAVSVAEAAALLRIGESTMRKLIKQGKVSSFQIGFGHKRRSLRVTIASIEALMREKDSQ